LFEVIDHTFARAPIKRQSNHQLDFQVDPPWRNWLARLTVIRYTRLMAHQEVESSSLSGGDNNFFEFVIDLLLKQLGSRLVFLHVHWSVCPPTKPISEAGGITVLRSRPLDESGAHTERQGLITPQCLSIGHIAFAATTEWLWLWLV
jgi:hypothetical protein